jgi:hypothetical protein
VGGGKQPPSKRADPIERDYKNSSFDYGGLHLLAKMLEIVLVVYRFPQLISGKLFSGKSAIWSYF